MNRPMKVVMIALCGALLSASGLTFAQNAEPAMISIRSVDVVPGKAAQFEAAVAKYREAMKKARPGEGFGVRVPAVGTPGNGYYVYRFLQKASDIQEGNVLVEAFGEKEGAAIAAQFDEAIHNTRVQTFVRRADLGRAMDVDDFEIVYVIRVDVAIGGEAKFEDYMHKLVEATAKVDKDTTWFGYSPGFGAGTTYRFAIPMNWADLDSPGMTIPQRLEKAFGEKEAAAILASRNSVVTGVQTSITVGRPDLGIRISN